MNKSESKVESKLKIKNKDKVSVLFFASVNSDERLDVKVFGEVEEGDIN